jgi:hypothetical protein
MWVQVMRSVTAMPPNQWRLCFQRCLYHYDSGDIETGFRFIWMDPQGRLRPQRGQARIPTMADMFKLAKMAEAEGWAPCDIIDGPAPNVQAIEDELIRSAQRQPMQVSPSGEIR